MKQQLTTKEFMEQMKNISHTKRVKLAQLELKHWDINHETELIANFRYTSASLMQRKNSLMRTISSNTF